MDNARVVASLLFVLVLGLLLLLQWSKRLTKNSVAPPRMRVKERLALQQGKVVYLVEVDQKEFLVATSNNALAVTPLSGEAS